MSSAQLSIRALTLGSALAIASAAQAVIINGSMTGPVGAGLTPPSWTTAQGSPDTVEALGPFNNTGAPWVLSPDGGTFVRAIGPSAGFSEAISQVITGLTIGVQYQVDFFQTNLAFEHPTSGDWWASSGQWDFFLDGGLFDSSSPMLPPPTAADPNVWEVGAVTFTATAVSHDLKLSPLMTAGTFAAYIGIDGLRLKEVPTPGAAALLALAGLTATRRRRLTTSH